MGGDNPPRISAIPWRIPARASGYPPAGADSAADGRFSAQTWRISGYPKGYPVPREAIPPGGIPPGELVYIPAHREESLPTSWCTYQLVGRDSFRRAGTQSSSSGGVPPGELVYIPARREESFRRADMYTSSSGGIPPDELVCIPARREEPLPTSWMYTSSTGGIPPDELDVHQLDGRDSSRRAGTQSSSSGGIPPGELVCIPARRKESLPTSWCTYQLVGRDSSRRAGMYTSSPGGIPPDERGADIRGYPRGYPPAPAGIRQRMRMRNSTKNVSCERISASERISGCGAPISTHDPSGLRLASGRPDPFTP
ncbi:hypothetical protein PGTUg99_008512 [Puccinia graminis f. sp. tritici]|uniref:Uncharacterized protein n=1 Tax=Puccinia graminis f. sp. tritici TaxID=56615 RepID=A0A5B0RVF0_PUCGR|nr:hypothetical protein PGTUg99_008512 [Puccinia graminis f. sp. tritici]